MLQVFPCAVQSTQAAPSKPHAWSRSRTSTLHRPSPKQQPEQLALPHGAHAPRPHRSLPVHATHAFPPLPHASIAIPAWHAPDASTQPAHTGPPPQPASPTQTTKSTVRIRAVSSTVAAACRAFSSDSA